ncbi:hypothetical protein D9M70_547170 [compost metagenome]
MASQKQSELLHQAVLGPKLFPMKLTMKLTMTAARAREWMMHRVLTLCCPGRLVSPLGALTGAWLPVSVRHRLSQSPSIHSQR